MLVGAFNPSPAGVVYIAYRLPVLKYREPSSTMSPRSPIPPSPRSSMQDPRKHMASACAPCLTSMRPRGVTVSTLNSESTDRGSNPCEAFLSKP